MMGRLKKWKVKTGLNSVLELILEFHNCILLKMKGMRIVDESIQQMIYKSRTIDEKIQQYTPNMEVDASHLKEWRNVRTLLTDDNFKEFLTTENITEHEFAFALQPLKDFEYKKRINGLKIF